MTNSIPSDLVNRSQQLLTEAIVLADAWRHAGRWMDAQTLLIGMEPVAHDIGPAGMSRHALTVGRLLTDYATFGGADTLAERDAALATALPYAEQTDDDALLGAIWDAKGMSLHTAYLDTGRTAEPADELPAFERSLAYRQQANDQAGIAESLFHVGLVYGVIRDDHKRALPYFQQSYALAQAIEDDIIASYAIRHIGFAHYANGDVAAARANVAESLHLREAAGFIPGVAMALGLASASC
ncbi:MAG: hypothetical protein H0X37_20115 [Herpetosiphonaceae bacterium]|nr:hypothetical protein [Herpetosiphonaceae bacterium]